MGLQHHGIVTKRLRDDGLLIYGIDIEWFASDAFIKAVSTEKPVLTVVPVNENIKPLAPSKNQTQERMTMYRFRVNSYGLWEIQILRWGFFWIPLRTPQGHTTKFDSLEKARGFAMRAGLPRAYKEQDQNTKPKLFNWS